MPPVCAQPRTVIEALVGSGPTLSRWAALRPRAANEPFGTQEQGAKRSIGRGPEPRLEHGAVPVRRSCLAFGRIGRGPRRRPSARGRGYLIGHEAAEADAPESNRLGPPSTVNTRPESANPGRRTASHFRLLSTSKPKQGGAAATEMEEWTRRAVPRYQRQDDRQLRRQPRLARRGRHREGFRPAPALEPNRHLRLRPRASFDRPGLAARPR